MIETRSQSNQGRREGLRAGQGREQAGVAEGRTPYLDMEITKNDDGSRGSDSELEAKIVKE